jgi:hypothetical protein
MICPKCNKGELVRRETDSSVLLECSRRGPVVKGRQCDYVEQYSQQEARKLENDAKKWYEANTPTKTA